MPQNQSQLDYFMDVVVRNYCRASEENEVLYEELTDVREVLSLLYKENSDLRFRLQEAGLTPPVSHVTCEEAATFA